MNEKSRSTLIMSGIIVLVVTIAIGLLCIDDWDGITGLAFAAIVWSEAVLFGGLMFAGWMSERTEQTMIMSTVSSLVTIYAGINIPVSVLYILFFEDANTSFTVIQLILLAVVAIGCISSISASTHVYEANGQTMRAVANAEGMIDRLNRLAVEPACAEFSPVFRNLSEQLRFTDISMIVPEDEGISNIISGIEIEILNSNQMTKESIQSALIRLNTLISQRKISVSAMKGGRR